MEILRTKKVILFGAANSGRSVLSSLLDDGLEKKNIVFYDNDSIKWGSYIEGIKVISLEELKTYPKNTPIFITSSQVNPIKEQLKKLKFEKVTYNLQLLHEKRYSLKYDSKFKNILSKTDMTNMGDEELFTIYSSLKNVSNLSGEIAEVGVYRGGSAKLLCETKGNKELHLFDTFKGIPKEQITKQDRTNQGLFGDASVDSVKEYLKKYKKVFFHKGIFPDSAKSIINKEFCLVHLDLDTYKGTLKALKFFYPRLVENGRIISHDYNSKDWLGVKKAFREFFKNNLEKIIEIADTQAMVIKY